MNAGSNGAIKSVNEYFFAALFFLSSITGLAQVADAGVTLTWNRNQESDIAGYRVYWGTRTHDYTDSVTIHDTASMPLRISYTFNGLDEGTTYYFAVKTIDLAGQESGFSDEVVRTSSIWSKSEDWLEAGSAELNHKWKKVTLNRTFNHPVVIAGPPTYNEHDPCVVRLRNITSNSFEIRIQEWNYCDQRHVTENVSYIVVEAGIHILPDGTLWEAGTYSLSGTLEWRRTVLSASFPASPSIFQTIQTFNGPQAVTVRESDITETGFCSMLQEEEALNDGHAMEIVGYLAVQKNSSTVYVKNIICNHDLKAIDTSLHVWTIIEEEQSLDTEVAHIYEQIGILEIDNYPFAQIQTFYGPDSAALRLRYLDAGN